MDEKNIKKPPSHITGIVIFGLCIFIGLIQSFNSVSKFNSPIWITLIFPTIFTIGIYGLIKVRLWGRIYCGVIMGLFFIFVALIPLIHKSYGDNFFSNIVIAIIIDSLLGWWLYSFVFGKNSKEYFKAKNT